MKRAKEVFRDGIKGTLYADDNAHALQNAEIVILAIEASSLEVFLSQSDLNWQGKLILCPVTRIERRGEVFFYHPFRFKHREVSAAEYVKLVLGDFVDVVSALQLVPASVLHDMNTDKKYDVPVAGERHASETIIKLLNCIDILRPLYAGPLEVSWQIESTLPLLLNLGRRNGFRHPGLKVIE